MNKLILTALVALVSSVTSYGYTYVARATPYSCTYLEYGPSAEGEAYTYKTLLTFYPSGLSTAQPAFSASLGQMWSKGFVWAYDYVGNRCTGYWDNTMPNGYITLTGRFTVYALGESLTSNNAGSTFVQVTVAPW